LPKKTNITIRTEQEFKDEMDSKADMLGLDRTKFIEMACQLLIDFDLVFIKKMQQRAEGLGMPLGIVIQNMIIKRLAEEAAEAEVDQERGREPSSRLLPEFVSKKVGDQYEPVTGGELFEKLKKQKKKRLIDYEVRDLKEKRKMLTRDLSKDEKEFLKKYS